MAAAVSVCHAKDYKYETVAGDPMHTRIYTLDNGLKVYLSVNKEEPRIQTFIAVRTGSRNDPAETTGLAHYLEHLMFKGTDKYGTSDAKAEKPLLDKIESLYEEYRTLTDPEARKAKYKEIDSISQVAAKYNIPNEYDKLMSSIGAIGTNAWTSNDCTNYTEDIPANEVENWAKIQSDRFKNMVIRGFHTELEAVYEEYNISLSKDIRKIFAAMLKKIFPTHPYGLQTTLGTQEHLKNPSIVNIKNYFHNYYCPNNTAICMAGDLNPDEVMAIIDKYFGDWKKNPDCKYPYFAPVKDLTAVTDTTVIGLEAEMLMLGWKFDEPKSVQTDTLEIIADLLSNGKAGLVDLDLNQKMKVLQAEVGLDGMRDYSIFYGFGVPKQGQSLEEVKDLIISEIEKVKNGDFDEKMLKAVVNNKKLALYRTMESNRNMANMFVDAFVNGESWESVVNNISRLEKITKQDVVAFAKRHFNNNYAIVYKKMGEDKNQKKIDKPAITPIPSNRDMESQFVTDIKNSHVKEIEPKFVDYDTDLTKTTTGKKKLPVLYVQNNKNGLFNLAFRYPFGTMADKKLAKASEYSNFIGTDKKSAAQLKQEFYNLACNSRISASDDAVTVYISGLAENMEAALELTEDFIKNMKADTEAWKEFVAIEKKSRQDNKLSQTANYYALVDYGVFGEYNPHRNTMSNSELENANPDDLVALLKALPQYEHEVLYYGPLTKEQLTAVIDKKHECAKKLAKGPENKQYTVQTTTANEVYLAPYDAKNIYMRQVNSTNRTWSPDHEPVAALFNEYYGGSMNGVVFQELRETRGLAYNAGARYMMPSVKGRPEYSWTHIITQNDKLKDCLSVFSDIVENVPQSQKAFDIAKQSLTKKLQTERTTKFSIINSYIRAREKGIDYDINKTIYDRLPSLTLQDIVKFEKETMAGKTWKTLILADEKNIDMDVVNKLGTIKRLTTEEIFGY